MAVPDDEDHCRTDHLAPVLLHVIRIWDVDVDGEAYKW